jgi:hypothetical protein
MPWWLGYTVVGWGLASWVIVRLSLPDPPPNPFVWFIASLAGLVGGGLGAFMGAYSSPMYGAPLVGALAGAAILLGVTRTFVRMPGTKR